MNTDGRRYPNLLLSASVGPSKPETWESEDVYRRLVGPGAT